MFTVQLLLELIGSHRDLRQKKFELSEIFRGFSKPENIYAKVPSPIFDIITPKYTCIYREITRTIIKMGSNRQNSRKTGRKAERVTCSHLLFF